MRAKRLSNIFNLLKWSFVKRQAFLIVLVASALNLSCVCASIHSQLESAISYFDPERTLEFNDGTTITAQELQEEIFRGCNMMDPLWKEFLQERSLYSLQVEDVFSLLLPGGEEKAMQFAEKNTNKPIKFNKLLDLGAGIGANSKMIAEQDIPVTAIDTSGALLDLYKENCTNKSLTCQAADITKLESFGENFEVILAIDVLPYLPPNRLLATMQKIHHALSRGGHFFGTIFTSNNVKDDLRWAMEVLGAHHYDGNHLSVQKFLEECGFLVIQIKECEEGGYSFHATKC